MRVRDKAGSLLPPHLVEEFMAGEELSTAKGALSKARSAFLRASEAIDGVPMIEVHSMIDRLYGVASESQPTLLCEHCAPEHRGCKECEGKGWK